MSASTSGAATASRGPTARAPRKRRGALRNLGWPLVVVVLLVAAGVVPTWFQSNYYFTGDTESGAYGQWYATGSRILEGRWGEVLNPTVWQAGLYLADGAWGFYSPVLWIIGIAVHHAGNLLTAILLIKVSFLVIAGLGSYALSRSFGILRPWAALAAVAVPLAGFTSYQDITSWVTGAISWSFLPWAWAGLRGFVHRGRNLLAALVPAALLLGIVYTHASLVLIAVTVAGALEAVVSRQRDRMVRAAVAGLAIALMVVIAHLPALLVFPSTSRQDVVTPAGAFVVTPASLLQSWLPFAPAKVLGTDGGVQVGNPLTYIAWFLPLVVLIRWRRFARLLPARLSLPVMVLVLTAFVMGPSQIGPLRWPLRVMPFLALAVIVLLVLGLARSRVARPGPVRLACAALLAVGGVLVSLPDGSLTAATTTGALGVLLLLAAVVGLLSRPPHLARPQLRPVRRRLPSRTAVAVVGATVVTALLAVPIHATFPVPGGPQQHLATSLAEYRHMLRGSKGDVFVIGNERSAMSPAMARQAALGNSWYLTGKPVQNTYTTLQYLPYYKLLCMGVKGSTCSLPFSVLFKTEPTTGRRWIDLFGISSLLLIKPTFPSTAWSHQRPGWHQVSSTAQTRLLVRDGPAVPGAGAIVWTSPGTTVRTGARSDLRVTFTVTTVGANPSVVFSRLPWPGYHVSGGAQLGRPTASMLLTVRLPRAAAGRTYTLSYDAPGLDTVALAGWALAALVAVWFLLQAGAARGARPLRRLVSGIRGRHRPAP